MIPLQALSPAMAVVLLSIVMTFVVIFGFIWAYNKISEPPTVHSDEDIEPEHSA